MQLQGRRGDRGGHPAGVAQAVGAQLRAGRPAVVLHRAVGGLRDARRRAVARRPPRRSPRCCTQAGPDQRCIRSATGSSSARVSLPLGQPGQLEAQRVGRSARRCRGSVIAGAQPPRVGHRQHDEPPHAARVQRGGGPAEQAAPVVPDDDGVLLAERPDQRGDVGGEGGQVVAARRLVAGAVAAQVGRDGVEPGVGQRRSAGRARSTRTAGTRAAAGPAGPRRPRRRAAGRRSRRGRGGSTGPGSRTLVASGGPSGGDGHRSAVGRSDDVVVAAQLDLAVGHLGDVAVALARRLAVQHLGQVAQRLDGALGLLDLLDVPAPDQRGEAGDAARAGTRRSGRRSSASGPAR